MTYVFPLLCIHCLQSGQYYLGRRPWLPSIQVIQISQLCAVYIVTPVWIHCRLWNNAQRLIYIIDWYMGGKISDLNKISVRLQGWSQLSNPSDSPCLFSFRMIKQNQLENQLVLLCHFCEAPFLLVKHTVTWISWNWHSYIVVDFSVGTLNSRNSKV